MVPDECPQASALAALCWCHATLTFSHVLLPCLAVCVTGPCCCLQRVADLLLECLSLDPAGRPTAQQLMHRLEAMQGRVNIGSATDDRAAFLAATPAHRLDP